jgi:sorting nexin-9/18/33
VEAVKGTGHAFFEIGTLFDEQPKQDWEPLGDFLHIYKGVISVFPEIFTNHKVRTITLLCRVCKYYAYSLC